MINKLLKNTNKIAQSSLLVLLFCSCFTTSAQPASAVLEKIIGQPNLIDENPYLLYSIENDNSSINKRSFLINIKNGNVRLEGSSSTDQNIVLLFNFKNKKSGKLFIDNKKSDDNTILEEALKVFYEDAKLLLTPILLILSPQNVKSNNDKIHSGQKIKEVPFSNLQFWDDNILNGNIIINSKDELIEITLSNKTYTIVNSKDIGGGIHLPTSFQRDGKTIQFLKVVAFTQIDEEKFNTL